MRALLVAAVAVPVPTAACLHRPEPQRLAGVDGERPARRGLRVVRPPDHVHQEAPRRHGCARRVAGRDVRRRRRCGEPALLRLRHLRAQGRPRRRLDPGRRPTPPTASWPRLPRRRLRARRGGQPGRAGSPDGDHVRHLERPVLPGVPPVPAGGVPLVLVPLQEKCSKTLRHRDHMHISLSKAGAKGLTSFYVDLLPATPSPPPSVRRVPRPPGAPRSWSGGQGRGRDVRSATSGQRCLWHARLVRSAYVDRGRWPPPGSARWPQVRSSSGLEQDQADGSLRQVVGLTAIAPIPETTTTLPASATTSSSVVSTPLTRPARRACRPRCRSPTSPCAQYQRVGRDLHRACPVSESSRPRTLAEGPLVHRVGRAAELDQADHPQPVAGADQVQAGSSTPAWESPYTTTVREARRSPTGHSVDRRPPPSLRSSRTSSASGRPCRPFSFTSSFGIGAPASASRIASASDLPGPVVDRPGRPGRPLHRRRHRRPDARRSTARASSRRSSRPALAHDCRERTAAPATASTVTGHNTRDRPTPAAPGPGPVETASRPGGTPPRRRRRSSPARRNPAGTARSARAGMTSTMIGQCHR